MCLMTVGITFSAGCEKYGGKKGLIVSSHPALEGVAEHLQPQMVRLMNMGLASSTWDGVRIIQNSISKMERKYDLDLKLPWTRTHAVNYVLALTMEQLAPGTVRTYISRVRSLHHSKGMTPGWEEDDIRLLMKGVCNLPRKNTPKKLAVTPALLRILKEKIMSSQWPEMRKHMVWAACCLLYNGALRAGEVLSPSASRFDASSTLRRRDLTLVKENVAGKSVTYIRMLIRNPKEFRSVGEVTVEILPAPGTFFCPVEAVRKFLKCTRGFPQSMPLLRTESTLLCKSHLNSILKEMLDPALDYGIIRSHSFRAGLTTALARAGVSDEILQSLGRWHSSAYRSYIKMGRNLRMSTQEKLISTLSEMASSNWGVSTALLVA